MCIRTIEELQEDTREKQIIDIRDAADFEKETYPGAVNIYWEELTAHMDEIRKDCPVYLLCYTGQKSEEIAEELTEQGYEIYSIKNGYRAWLKMKLSK
ncbi:MAG: rhodanese-like domain-containing protein, partial [Blautia obeum]